MSIPRSSLRREKVPPLNYSLYEGMLPVPQDLGIQGRFKEWRWGQVSAIMTSVDAETRVVMECLPTGAGKTLIYMAEAVMNGGKVVILTSTKGQQDQIVSSFPDMVTDVRGQTNYRCEAVKAGGEYEHLNPKNEWVSVADGPCQEGAVCPLKDGGCGYFDQIRKAKRAKIVVTNYAFWMTNARMPQVLQITDGGGPVDLLICDEAHEAVDEVCGFLQVEINKEDEKCITSVLDIRLPSSTTVEPAVWRDWATLVGGRLLNALEEARSGELRQKKKLRKLAEKMAAISRMNSGWVVEWSSDQSQSQRSSTLVRFDPVWPTSYAEALLFRGAKKVIMSSATVREKCGELLAIKCEDMSIFESMSAFDVAKRPIYRIPCMQMNWRNESKEGAEKKWVECVLRIIKEGREDRNGIVHTTSYKRRNALMQEVANTSNRRLMLPELLVHSSSSSDVQRAVSRLRSEQPRILASPSVTTGYDFPDKAARWQAIVKLPMPDTRGKVVKARCKEDEEYGPHQAATTLQQMTGRIVRNEWDWGETFILDDNVVWFIRRWKKLFAEWWLEAYKDWGQTMNWARGEIPTAPEIEGDNEQ